MFWQNSIEVIQPGKNYWISFILCLLFFTSCASAKEKQKAPKVLTEDFYAVGLVYHRFNDARYPSTNTPDDKFEAHLEYLLDNGFKTYTASNLYSNSNDSVKKIFITIDDGLKSFYTNGWSLLKKHNCQATLFVNTESVGWGDYMNWEQIREVHKAGIEIGSHSHQHNYFLNYPDSMREKAFKADLEVAEKLFMDSLGFIPKVYAYPYGEFDKQMSDVLKEKGYDLAFAQNSGVWSNETNLLCIPRFPVAGNYVGMQQFKLKVNMKPMKVSGLNDYPIELNEAALFSSTLKPESGHTFRSLNFFFNNKYNDKVDTFNGDSIKVALHMPASSRRVLYTITAQDKNNQWHWWSKLFINTNIR
ncbi:polysaccharide deacetylase family protein [Labilibacter marinus]|uniref:polysaccharide deacetylase family protein n=1 Tax=Labilibacter marinus TaxID=1477105 RepID=UPI0013019611|nr:polysaccharide deacetylase family protein [Labilibacter marinus]